MPAAMRPARPGPGRSFERSAWAEGAEVVVGVDEVGRGAWAGPLTVAAVVIPRTRRPEGVRDSKQIPEERREQLFERVAGWCEYWSVGHATPAECDRLGMSRAQRLAARRAVDGLGVRPEVVLVDGPWDFVGVGDCRTIVRGDTHSVSIAAASILAKVTRDRMMRSAAVDHPGFDLDLNKGYPCPRHIAALQGYGPTAIHRRSWVFMEHHGWGHLRVTPLPAGQDPLQGSLFAP